MASLILSDQDRLTSCLPRRAAFWSSDRRAHSSGVGSRLGWRSTGVDGSWVGGAAAAVWEDGPRDMFGGLCAGSKGAGSLSFSCGRSCAGDRSLGSRTSKQEARARGRTQMTHSHPAWGVQPTLGFSGRGCPTAAQALSSDACTLSPRPPFYSLALRAPNSRAIMGVLEKVRDPCPLWACVEGVYWADPLLLLRSLLDGGRQASVLV